MAQRDHEIPVVACPVSTSDSDPAETAEWRGSTNSAIDSAGPTRAPLPHARNQRLAWLSGHRPRMCGRRTTSAPSLRRTSLSSRATDSSNGTHPAPYVRWNAAIMVHRAQSGQVSASAVTYELRIVGTLKQRSRDEPLLRGPNAPGGADQIFWQGHASRRLLRRGISRRPPDRNMARRVSSGEPHPAADSRATTPRLIAGLLALPDACRWVWVTQLRSTEAHFNRYLATVASGHIRPTCGAFLGDGGWTSRNRPGALAAPAVRSSTTSRSSSAAICSASMAPCASTADHPGTRVRVPRRRMETSSKGRLGPQLGSAARR